MEKKYTRVSYPARYHLYVLLGYALLVFGLNIIGNPSVNALGVILLIGINIAVFYSLNAIFDRLFASVSKRWLLGVQLLALMAIWYAFVYVMIYVLFPDLGSQLFGAGREFHLGKYIRNLTVYLEKSLMAVVIYQYIKLNKARGLALLDEKEKTIVQERQLKEAAQRELVLEREAQRVERENQRLLLAASSSQLKSHWLHAVTATLRKGIRDGINVETLFDGYTAVLNYYYQHGGTAHAQVLLKTELHLARLMQQLNEAVNGGRKTFVIQTGEPLIARQIPPFIITTIVENAFKFADQSDPRQPITLTVHSTPAKLTIACQNQIDPAKVAASPPSGVGLYGVQQQLDYFAPSRHSIAINNENRAYGITITIYFE